jgi:hypothetical protein
MSDTTSAAVSRLPNPAGLLAAQTVHQSHSMLWASATTWARDLPRPENPSIERFTPFVDKADLARCAW